MSEGGAGSPARAPAQPLRRVGVGGRTEEFAPNGLTPVQAEAAIAAEPVEWLYVFDASDRQIARFRGTPEEVDLSDELKARTGVLGLYGEPVLRDHLIVHNHPVWPEVDLVASFPPSPSDLVMAVERDLRTLIVVSGPRRYVLRRPGPLWPLDEDVLDETLDDLIAEHRRLSGPAVGSLPRRVARMTFILRRLAEMGVIEHEEQVRTSSV